MKQEKFRRVSVVSGLIVSTAMLAVLLTFPGAQAQDKTTGTADIPPGTILPVRLNESLSSSKSRPGQMITARIMQDVPLATGGKIREGSKVIGHVVGVSSPADGNGDTVSLQFDKLISSGRTIPIRTISGRLRGSWLSWKQKRPPTVRVRTDCDNAGGWRRRLHCGRGCDHKEFRGGRKIRERWRTGSGARR